MYLEYIQFFIKNFHLIKNVIEELGCEYQELKQRFISIEFLNQLNEIEKYCFIVPIIKKLESSELTINEQIAYINEVEVRLKDTKYFERFTEIFKNNPDFMFFKNFSPYLCIESDKIFKYMPLNTSWVERSFSSYNLILKPERSNLNVENLKMLLFFYFNK